MAMQPDGALPYRDPVIIGGAPRTGVRLLASILDGHAALASGPELPFILTMAHQWRDIAVTLGANHARHHRLPPEATRENFRMSILRLVMPRVSRAGKKRFVYHSFGAAVSLDVLADLLPSARFIVMLRDPRDVARSLLGCHWRNPRDGQPLPYTRDPVAAARLWVDFTTLALRSQPTLLAGARLMMLRYEDLCARPLDMLLRLGSFLGESPPPARVAAESARLVTVSTGDPPPPLRVGDVDSNSVGLWRTSLDAGAVTRIEEITAGLRPRLGYS